MATLALLSGEAEKLGKAAAGYRDDCPGCLNPCFMCHDFDPHLERCAKVEGHVLPAASCDLAAVPAPPAVIEPPDDDANVIRLPLWGSKRW